MKDLNFFLNYINHGYNKLAITVVNNNSQLIATKILLAHPSRQRTLVILLIYEITPHHLLHDHMYH
ncbi:Uncharacterised protein [Klebsiella pneumoniae subsp. pneumoniae]|nr:Uncharacterised protein [Klebsiella pneumoniae subsp. pneumoniae]